MKRIVEANRANCLNIVVLGDTIIDDYKYGHVTRVSPEFPVQILTRSDDREELCPGGAANVCQQMTHFNVESYLIGLIDQPAQELYAKQKFKINHCVNLLEGRVPRKTRFYDGDFPLLRYDDEKPNYGENEECLTILRQQALYNFLLLLEKTKIDAVILSDYNKGFWTDNLAQEVINRCNCRKIPTIVDPKKELDRWADCTYFKPNASEAASWCNKPWKEQVDYFQSRLNCKGVIITQSGKGIVGKVDDEQFEHWTFNKLSSKEVNSTIGAGDCFISILAIALGHGFKFEEGCRLGFEGGVQYVKARHNRPITPYDVYKRFDAAAAKIIPLEDLLYLKNNVYTKDEFVFTNGCFDLLHRGHLNTLQFAKGKGHKLVVGVNSDDSIKRLKGKERPIQKFYDRAAMLAAVDYVDFIVEFKEDTPEELIKALKPSYLVKGGDYKFEKIVGTDYVKETFLAPVLEHYSTTRFIEKMTGRTEWPEL